MASTSSLIASLIIESEIKEEKSSNQSGRKSRVARLSINKPFRHSRAVCLLAWVLLLVHAHVRDGVGCTRSRRKVCQKICGRDDEDQTAVAAAADDGIVGTVVQEKKKS
jgi:hypothetical protein